jgi:hypothetical protein
MSLHDHHVSLIYPFVGKLPASDIIRWAADLYEDGVFNAAPESLEHAIEMLEDAGIITVEN